MFVVKVMQRRQVVIPKELFDALNLETGDYLEAHLEDGKLVYVPKKIVDRDEWYASHVGKETIEKALHDIKEGKGKEFGDVESLIKDLDS